MVAGTGEYADATTVNAFIEAINGVCREHGFWIGHEDTQGAFLIHRCSSDEDLRWFNDAMIGSK